MELEYPQFHFPGGERELERQHCWDCGGEDDRLVRINGERSGEGNEEDCGREREEEEALKCFRRYEREVSGEGNLWHNGEKEECETEERGDREGVGRGEEGGGGGVSREENGIRSRESEAEMCRGEEVKTGKEREDGRGGDTRRGDEEEEEEVYSGFEEKRGATGGGEQIEEQEENGEREEEEQGEREEEEQGERDEEEGNWKKNGECSTVEEKKNSCTDEVEEEEVEREIKREGDGRKEERRDKQQDNINGREEHDVQDKERDEEKEVEEEDEERQVEGEKYEEEDDGRRDEEECNENEEEFEEEDEDGACVAEVKGESECPECLRRPVLYCVDEQLPLCWACGLSEPHDGHTVCAPEEALQDSRVEVSISMQPIFQSLKNLKRVQETYRHMAKHLPSQSAQTERQIQDQFEELRRFLRREEEARVAAVREEQERKARALRERAERMRGEVRELLHALRASQMEMEMEGEDNGLHFLQNYKKTLKRVWKVNQSPEKSYDSLIDVPKHVGNLRFRVWEKMKEICPYSPVTLDPNTAGPFLLVSGDLTSVRNSGVDIDADGDILDADDNNRLPDNPESFTSCGEMLACEVISISESAQRQPLRGRSRSRSLGFGVGRGCRRPAGVDAADSAYTSWVVDVGDNSNWMVGVARRSVSRKSPVAACPENGRWALSLRRSCYEASESPAAPLPLSFCGERGRRLQGPADTAPGLRRVKVRVSHGSGRVCFTDADRHTHLYTFSHTAAGESLQPYFSTACHRRYPLRVLPASVTVTTSRQGPGGEDEEEEEEDE